MVSQETLMLSVSKHAAARTENATIPAFTTPRKPMILHGHRSITPIPDSQK